MGGILPGGEQVQYATNAQYRAWGALKGLDYGTGLQMRMSFNNRLQAEQYSLLGRRYYYSNGQTDALSISYQYYADGRLRFSEESHSQTNAGAALFARSYEYDFMGRLTLAKTGAEARGQVETDLNKRPYRQSFTYDAFGDMTKADRWHWSQNYVTIPEGGTDEDGRPLGTYDAGGRLISDASPGSSAADATTFWRDGKGQILKSRASGNACEQDLRCERTTYYVRSSVLDGEVINELSETYHPAITFAPGVESPARTDHKLETYIFAGGARIAKHEIVTNSSSYANRNHDTTYIENRDASGVFFDEMILRGTGPVYDIGGAAITRPNFYLESDPFGAEVRLKNPYIPPPPDDYGPPPCAGPEPDDCGYPEDEEEEYSFSGSDYDEEGYGNPVAFTCYVEGIPHRCEEVFGYIEKVGQDSFSYSREGELLAPSSTGPQSVWKDEYSTKSLGDVINDISPNGSPNQVIAQVNIGIENEGYFILGNANWDAQVQTRQPQNPAVDLRKVDTLLQNPTCQKFLNGVLREIENDNSLSAILDEDHFRDYFGGLDTDGAFHNARLRRGVLGEAVNSGMINIDVSKARAGSINAVEYTAIHESFHPVNVSIFQTTHFTMATAAYKVGTGQGLFKGMKRITPVPGLTRRADRANSGRFDRMLFAACPPR